MRNDPIALDCAYKVCVRKCKKSKIDIQQNKLNYIYSTFHCSMFLWKKHFCIQKPKATITLSSLTYI